jgi:hypothetical protein
MEQKLNIAEILKDKLVGLKLYSSTFGYIKFNGVHKDKIYFFSEDTNAHSVKQNGKMYDGGECIIFPSKKMRDWKRFSWKKGDVLISNDGYIEVIFDKWYDDTYTSFYCKHYLNSEDKNKIVYYEEFLCTTARYSLKDKDTVQTYIKTIEERLGGKLNMETLEIDKTQPEFKDGDIIKMTWDKYSAIAIFWEYSNFGKGFDSHVFFNIKIKIIEYNIHGHTLKDLILRLATEEEKQQLFDALAKRGKAWDTEKKQIVDLKPKVELKPFDKVIVRCNKADKWSIDFFSYKVSNGYICTGDAWFGYCLPYNEETAHLLGTTDDLEGR